MIFIGLLVASGIVGWFAQYKKQRLGMLWGTLTFLVGLPWLTFMGLGIQTAGAEDVSASLGDFALAIIPPSALMLGVLLVLRKPAAPAPAPAQQG